MLFPPLADDGGLDVTIDGQHTVVGADQGFMQGSDIVDLDLRDAFFGASTSSP